MEASTIIIENNVRLAQYAKDLRHNERAMGYLLGRGLNGNYCNKWDIGYASNQEADYSVLNNRITFGIRDWQGRLLSFSGRTVGKARGAKYMGMTDTPVFEKFKNVYGIDKALPHIVSSGVAVIVEGYLDVIACHEKGGLPMTVGTMGIALTDWQVLLLARWARVLIIAMDGDRAGKQATAKAVEDYCEAPVRLATVSLPQGKDPFDLAMAQGAAFGNWVKSNLREYKR